MNPECFGNVTWAMQTGIVNFDYMYTNYSGLTATSSRNDFQCALYGMSGSIYSGTSWSCPPSCDSNFTEICAPPTLPPTAAPTVPTIPPLAAVVSTTVAPESSSSIPWWVWLLLAALGLAMIIVGVSAGRCAGKKEAPKKKRALAPPPPPPKPKPEPVAEPTPVMQPMPVFVTTVAAPVQQFTYAAPQVAQYTALPVVNAGPPVYTATTAQPVTTSQPIALTAQYY